MARLSQSPSLLISGSGSWPQLARDRDANSSRQNDVINLMRFFAGGTSRALALSFAFAAENIKNLPLVKKFEFDLLASLPSAEQINYLPRQLIDQGDPDKSRFFTLTELNTVNPLLSPLL